MYMVPHQAVSQQSETAHLSAFQKDLQELLFVLFVLKNLLLIDSSQHNVINFALCMLSGLSWHSNHPVLEYHNSSVLSTQRTVPCVTRDYKDGSASFLNRSFFRILL